MSWRSRSRVADSELDCLGLPAIVGFAHRSELGFLRVQRLGEPCGLLVAVLRRLAQRLELIFQIREPVERQRGNQRRCELEWRQGRDDEVGRRE